jgi:hypothetical protein
MQVSSLSFTHEKESEGRIEKKVEELQENTVQIATEETVTRADLDTARLGLDNPDRKPTKEQSDFVETNQHRIGMPVMRMVIDDGFDVLTADEYLAVRAKPALERLKRQLPPLSHRKETLQALTYITTGTSVLLGTLHMDLYIAITTAAVSLLTGIMEYQKLEATVINLNNASRTLAHMMMWWDSLSFVERRMVRRILVLLPFIHYYRACPVLGKCRKDA